MKLKLKFSNIYCKYRLSTKQELISRNNKGIPQIVDDFRFADKNAVKTGT